MESDYLQGGEVYADFDEKGLPFDSAFSLKIGSLCFKHFSN